MKSITFFNGRNAKCKPSTGYLVKNMRTYLSVTTSVEDYNLSDLKLSQSSILYLRINSQTKYDTALARSGRYLRPSYVPNVY